jgi:hypothetical protein
MLLKRLVAAVGLEPVLLNLGLLDDPDGKMRAALSHPDDVPYLPVPRGYGEGGFGSGGYGGDRPPKGPPDKP